MKIWIAGVCLAVTLGTPLGARGEESVTTGGAAAPGKRTAGDASGAAAATKPPGGVAADNTGRNERDRQEAAVTPMDQSNEPADIELTQRIRRAVVAEEGLSMNARNVKIISANGVVTLRGPVDSPDEKAKIEAAAEQIAGAKNVRNQLEVTTTR